jgi:uncharacterized protein (DUF2147 family)
MRRVITPLKGPLFSVLPKIKSGLAALVVMSLVSCTSPQNPPVSLSSDKRIVNNNGISNNYIIDVGKGQKGASFSIEIKFSESSPAFKTAANANGTPAKTTADIQSYVVYLVKNDNTASYPLNGDPLGAADLVAGPFTITNSGAASRTVTFANVNTSGSNAYYAAVRAKDSGNNDLIKINNGSPTPWTGATAAANGQVAVSTGAGIIVDASLVVNTPTPLSVVPKLLDAVGAIIQTDVAPSSGSTFIPSVGFSTSLILGEFKVNTYTTNSQTNPSVAMDSAGDFVAAWQSTGQDGDSSGIYAQRYNASGNQNFEFKVNTYITNNQLNPSVAMDSAGDFVIAWQSYGQDGSFYGIYAQRYNADGSKPSTNGGEFQVNTTVNSRQINPAVAVSDASGNFVIAWQSAGGQDGSGYGIYAQRYNAAGATQGAEFKVNTYTTNSQTNPSVAMDSAGNFVITWQSDQDSGSGTNGGNGIYAQRYNADGSKPLTNGVEFKVNTYTTDIQGSPTAAMDSAGDFVIAWQSAGGQDGSGYGIYAQRYNAAGATQGAEFKVNTYTTNAQINPSVAMDSAANFVITWQSDQDSGSGTNGGNGIYAQRYNADGSKPSTNGVEFKVNTYTTDIQGSPTAAMDSAGDFVIIWKSGVSSGTGQDGSNYGVYAHRYNAQGVPN